MFTHPGDPTKDTGPNDLEYVDTDFSSCGDRQFLMSTGPFTMAPGDSQEVIYGIINVAAGDALESYLYLKEIDIKAQLFIDNQFQTLDPPAAPIATVTPLTDQIILTWENNSESYIMEDNISALPIDNQTNMQFNFEVYNR